MATTTETSLTSYQDFWAWFGEYEQEFHQIVKDKGDIEHDFLAKISLKILEVKDGFYFLTGMVDDDVAELIVTADGAIKNMAFIEDFVAAAPAIKGWKFVALKPALNNDALSIEMEGYTFSNKNIHFYANNRPDYPDEINITIVHDDLNKENRDLITNGIYLFLDNFLGELDFATTIDRLTVIGKHEVKEELIPIGKLRDFLIWREKEFVEKYVGIWHTTEQDKHAMFEAKLENGLPLIAVINRDLLDWESKPSHPWILRVHVKFDWGTKDGMPDKPTYELLDELEKDILAELNDASGYLNIGRQTAEGVRQIYFACKEFRKPSKVIQLVKLKYTGRLAMDFDIYKDKYWQSFNQFMIN